MKTVSLCGGSCKCPVVKIGSNEVLIGESGNLCVLKKNEWKALVEKVKSGELE